VSVNAFAYLRMKHKAQAGNFFEPKFDISIDGGECSMATYI